MSGALERALAGYVGTIEHDAARIGLDPTRQHVKQRGLAGTIRPGHTKNFATLDGD